MKTSDFLVIGGGIVGISVAKELKKRNPDCSVTVLEKEKECGLHGSGRNSGVLHAGFYYTSDSLKAKFTKEGNQLLTEYCEQYNLPINKCGKLVVAKNESELSALDELIKRGRVNGIDIQEISAEDARLIEPRVLTYERALFAPTTASVDPVLVVKHMQEQAKKEGIKFLYDTAYLKKEQSTIRTTKGRIQAGYVINTAGLYADKVAVDFGFSQEYRILPFKGLYLYSNSVVDKLKTHVYPVPDLRNPFLGVHFTVAVDGSTQLGPTAIPAFWRENYNGLDNFKFSELVDIVAREIMLFAFADFDFLQLTLEEIQKYSRKHLIKLASKLVTGVDSQHFTNWGRPGIRAQLINIKNKQLEMDFVIQGDDKSIHILNTVSPGFTCSIPFARYICNQIENFM
jgi:L-2-hydroxyglutarate oxidase LhgO